jgi:hypothetical protein
MPRGLCRQAIRDKQQWLYPTSFVIDATKSRHEPTSTESAHPACEHVAHIHGGRFRAVH